jgi:hypothetical protein
MGAASPPPRWRSPPAVAWILLLAVLVGVAAALISRPVGTVAPGAPVVGGVTLEQFLQVCAAILILGLGFAVFMLLRNRGSRAPIPERLVAAILLTLLLGVLMVVLLHLVHVAPIPYSGNSSSPTGPSGYPTNNSTTPPLNFLGNSGVALPAWAGFAVLIGIAALAAWLLVPYAVARAEHRRRALEQAEGPAAQAQQALREALHRLESADVTDARTAILALYYRLLLLVGPRLGTVDSRTPREIERDSIAQLGLRPSVAQDLTETFEEARYSSHSMTSDSVARARTALRQAIADLAKSPGAPP